MNSQASENVLCPQRKRNTHPVVARHGDVEFEITDQEFSHETVQINDLFVCKSTAVTTEDMP